MMMTSTFLDSEAGSEEGEWSISLHWLLAAKSIKRCRKKIENAVSAARWQLN